MYRIDNKFDIGEECFTYYRKNIQEKCPLCKGTGKFHGLSCGYCFGTGILIDNEQTVKKPCKVKITKVIMGISVCRGTIKYKVLPSNDLNVNIGKRREDSLFKTYEEADRYCKEANTREGIGAF